MAFGVEDPHAKASGASGHGFADGTEADDPQGFAVSFTSHKMHRLAAGKEAGPKSAVGFHDSASRRQEERPVKIRGGFGDEGRNRGDGNAPGRCGCHVNSGGRDRHRGDQLESRARVDHFSVYTIVKQAEEIVVPFESRDQLSLRDDVSSIRIQFDFRYFSESSQRFLRDRLGDKDSWS